MRNHKKLQVFVLADSLALRVYATTRKFPEDERYGLTSQIRRAAVSIAANIVEGAARPSDADFRRLLIIAYSSARELEYELSLATRLGYISSKDTHALQEQASRTCRALYGLIQVIRS